MNFKPTKIKTICSSLGGFVLAIILVLIVVLSGRFPGKPLCGIEKCFDSPIPVPLWFWILTILILTIIFGGLIYLVWSLATKKNK
ncbi:hypothetical protein J4437_02150 [Candidatus Woesearchaeota archaeon]|nr:hypothetical protein [Candidatus Woesearchaeota archaeon]